MATAVQPSQLKALAQVAAMIPGVQVLVLYGSRARGDAGSGSDWDLGYLGDPDLDQADLLLAVIEALHTDAVDLADLSRAGGLLRFRVARDGQTLFERTPGLMDRFRLEAADFWCDAAPVLEPGLEAVLTEPGR